MTREFPIIAVDIGNARIKLGLFRGDGGDLLPEPRQTLQLAGDAPDWEQIVPWLELADGPGCHKDESSPRGPAAGMTWWIGSVNRPATTRLLDWLREHRPEDGVTLLAAGDLTLTVELKRPDMVGIDRLLSAVAANRLRRPGQPAIVVDVGTAITVDLVSAEGAFLGGAILPGIAMSARAMHEFTDLLPLVEMSELAAPPPPLGTSTVPAMQSGLFWGAVGAIRELIRQLAKDLDSNDLDSNALDSEPHVFLTGGAGPAVAELLGHSARHVPHLTLAGIALAAQRH